LIAENLIFSFKVLCRPLDSSVRGGPIARPTLDTPLILTHIWNHDWNTQTYNCTYYLCICKT